MLVLSKTQEKSLESGIGNEFKDTLIKYISLVHSAKLIHLNEHQIVKSIRCSIDLAEELGVKRRIDFTRFISSHIYCDIENFVNCNKIDLHTELKGKSTVGLELNELAWNVICLNIKSGRYNLSNYLHFVAVKLNALT